MDSAGEEAQPLTDENYSKVTAMNMKSHRMRREADSLTSSDQFMNVGDIVRTGSDMLGVLQWPGM